MTLKHAAVQVDIHRLNRDEHVFSVVTPHCTVVCKTKHAVALSEWVAVLEATLMAQGVNSGSEKRAKLVSRPSDISQRSLSGHEPNSPLSPVKSEVGSSGSSQWSLPRRNSLSLLQNVQRLLTDTQCFDHLYHATSAWPSFRQYLIAAKGSTGDFDFFAATSHLYHVPQPPTQTQQQQQQSNGQTAVNIPSAPPTAAAAAALDKVNQAAMAKYLASPSQPSVIPPPLTTPNEVINYALGIHDRFITTSAPCRLSDLPASVLTSAAQRLAVVHAYGNLSPSLGPMQHVILASICVGVLDTVRKYAYHVLLQDFERFVKSTHYENAASKRNGVKGDGKQSNGHYGEHKSADGQQSGTLSSHGSSSTLGGAGVTREVEPFESSLQPYFLLKQKIQKQSQEIKMSKKKSVLTIGRDKSNSLVIEDSRVSRSHARIEWHEAAALCEYIDLGSSCGSKLNGKLIERAKLQPGDVLELGQTTLIFQLKKKRKFSLF